MAKKRYTRKQLKQPDEFISLSNRVWVWVSEHLARVLVMIAVVLLIIGGVSLYRHLATRKAKQATAAIMRAMAIYGEPVDPAATKDSKSAAGVPRYRTKTAKLEATAKALTEVVDRFGGKAVAALAHLHRAAVRFDLGKHDLAAKDYEAYLKSRGSEAPQQFRVTALEGIIYCHEARKMWDQALATVKRLPQSGDLRYTALFHEARILAAKGDSKGAADRLKRIVDKAKSRALVDRAGQRLALLEKKK